MVQLIRGHYFILISVLTLLGTSCSKLIVVSGGTIPIYLSDRHDHQRFAKLEGRKENYLWGLISPDNTIELDYEFSQNGYASVADIHVEEKQSAGDFFATVLSLGFYCPRHYKITGRGIKK
jgi:hypothetical protein